MGMKNKSIKGILGIKTNIQRGMGVSSKVKSSILQILTHGCTNMGVVERPVEKVMEKSILNIKKKEKVKNINIRKKTGAKDITYVRRKPKIKYERHVGTQSNER